MRKKKMILSIVLLLAVFGNTFLSAPAYGAEATAKEAVVLQIGNAWYSQSGELLLLAEDTWGVSPFMQDDRVYVPVKFAASVLQADTALLDKTQRNGTDYVQLKMALEQTGKEAYYQDGLVWIDYSGPAFSDAQIQEWKFSLNGVVVVGSDKTYQEVMEAGNNSRYYDGYVIYEEDAIMESASADSAAEPAAERASAVTTAKDTASGGDGGHSETNVQVAGVDEGDIIKTDGKRIYYAKNDKVHILFADPLQSLVSWEEEGAVQDMYLYGERLVVVFQKSRYSTRDTAEDTAYFPFDQGIAVNVYNVSQLAAVELERTYGIEGNYVSSRRIGDTFYLVSNAYYYQLYRDGGYAVPAYLDSANGKEAVLPLDRIVYFPEQMGSNLTTVAAFDLNNPKEEANTYTYIGSGQNLYVSQENMYVVEGQYKRVENTRDYGYQSNIYKFSLGKGDVQFEKRGQVPGNIINQFSMDEHNGYFRIATNDTSGSQTVNKLFVMDKDLSVTGVIDDIAPGERIYSVRFMGDEGYMVTFKQIDPLFTFDLSDPYAPKILGELKVPGYSAYLHPYGEHYLMGFGMEVTEDGFVEGFKISMFDVGDMNTPKELFKTIIPGASIQSELLYNHKALLFDPERNILAFPVIEYGGDYFQGVYVYDVDLETGFTLKGTISHMDQVGSMNVWAYVIERIIYIGDNFYTLSEKLVRSTDIGSMEYIDTLMLE